MLKTLAATLDIKTQYYIPNLSDIKAILGSSVYIQKSELSVDKVLFVLKGTKTTDGTELAHPEMLIEVSGDSTTIKCEVKLAKMLEKSDTSPLADKMVKEIGLGAMSEFGYGFFNAKFTIQNNSFDNA